MYNIMQRASNDIIAAHTDSVQNTNAMKKLRAEKNLWAELTEPFDEKIARRAAIMLKPRDESRQYVYPMHTGVMGFQFDEGMFSGYEENPYLSIHIAPWYYPSYSGPFAAPSSVVWESQTYAPDCVQRTVLLPNAGFRVNEFFCRPEDDALLWRMVFRNLANYLQYRIIFFIVVSAPEIRRLRVRPHGFAFRPARLPCATDAAGRPRRMSANTGLDRRPLVERRQDPLAGDFDMFLSVEALDWGSYDTTEDYLAAINQGRLNRHADGRRHLVLAVKAEPDRPRESQAPTGRFRDITAPGARGRTIALGLSYRSLAQAARVAAAHDPIAPIARRWNHWLRALPPLASRNPRAQKAYYKNWWVVRLNYYKHPRFGHMVLEAPVYTGFWICNHPTADLISRLDPVDRGGSFRMAMDLFCRAMNAHGCFPHAMYLKEKTYGAQWLAAEPGVASIPNTAWAVLAWYRARRDRAALKRWYPYLARYYGFLCRAHDPDKNNLWCITSLHDSFDTTPTSERVRQRFEPHIYTPEYGSEKFFYEDALARMAVLLGCNHEARMYRRSMKTTLAALHTTLWDEKQGWFGARHADGSLDSRIGLPGLFPLAYGLATPHQAELARPNVLRLICKYGVRTFAKGQPGYAESYWRGPVWATSILYGLGAALRYYPDLVDPIHEGMLNYSLAHPTIWELLEGDRGAPAATDYGFLGGSAYGGVSFCGAAALIAALRMRDQQAFLPVRRGLETARR